MEESTSTLKDPALAIVVRVAKGNQQTSSTPNIKMKRVTKNLPGELKKGKLLLQLNISSLCRNHQ